MYSLKQILRRMNHLLQYLIIVTLQSAGNIFYHSSPKMGDLEDGAPKILVIRLDEIGDMVMMSSFLRELRRNYPTAHITLVVNLEYITL